MGRRDQGIFPREFLGMSHRVWQAILSWGPLPTQETSFVVKNLELHTDGSAVLSSGWPVSPVNAGWGFLVFAIGHNEQRAFLGAAWGPVHVQQASPYCFRGKRSTIPIAELSAMTHVLRILRRVAYAGAIHWFADSLYALGIVLGSLGATTELELVTVARTEASFALERWALRGTRTPSRI